MTLTGSCDKHSFTTPQQQQANTPQGQYSQGQYPPSQRANPHTGDHQNPRQSKQAQHICELCRNKGHYDYQCQIATDFMQRTQKAFQCSHYSHEVNNDQEWSQGEDHDDHQQPFQ